MTAWLEVSERAEKETIVRKALYSEIPTPLERGGMEVDGLCMERRGEGGGGGSERE